jgi:hypothetical protein
MAALYAYDYEKARNGYQWNRPIAEVQDNLTLKINY